jgi:hypothetical protein
LRKVGTHRVFLMSGTRSWESECDESF